MLTHKLLTTYGFKAVLLLCLSCCCSNTWAKNKPILNLALNQTYRINCRNVYNQDYQASNYNENIKHVEKVFWEIKVIQKTKQSHLLEVRCTRRYIHIPSLNNAIDSEYLTQQDRQSHWYSYGAQISNSKMYWRVNTAGRITHSYLKNPLIEKTNEALKQRKDSVWIFPYFEPAPKTKHSYVVKWEHPITDVAMVVPISYLHYGREAFYDAYGKQLPKGWEETKAYVIRREPLNFSYRDYPSLKTKIEFQADTGSFTAANTIKFVFDRKTGWPVNGKSHVFGNMLDYTNPDQEAKSPQEEGWRNYINNAGWGYNAKTPRFEDAAQVHADEFLIASQNLKKDQLALGTELYQQFYWGLQYRYAHVLLRTWSVYDNVGDVPLVGAPPFVTMIDTLSTVNDVAMQQPIFAKYLLSLLEYRIGSLAGGANTEKVAKNQKSLNERFTLAGLMYKGMPRFLAQSALLQEAFEQGFDLGAIKPVYEAFTRQYGQTKAAESIKKLYQNSLNTEPGKTFLTFSGTDEKGQIVTSAVFKGKKVLLNLFDETFNSWISPNDIDLWKLKKAYPQLQVIHLGLVPDYKKQQELYKTLKHHNNGKFVFVNNTQLIEQIRTQLNWNIRTGKCNRIYLIDEDWKIYDYLLRIDENMQFVFNEEFVEKVPKFLKQAPPDRYKHIKKWAWNSLRVLVTVFLSWWLTGLYIRRRERIRRQRLEIQLQAIRAQLNPHFVFNTMNAIQHLMLSHKTEKAQEYLAELGGLMRSVLNLTKDELVSIHEELNIIQQYCKLEALRKDFELSIKIDPQIDPYNTLIPPMVLQPLVENSIVHGFLPLTKKGQLEIEIQKNDQFIEIWVKDNGIGLELAQDRGSKGLQKSLELNRQRLQLMYKGKARFSLKARPSGQGVEALIQLPIES